MLKAFIWLVAEFISRRQTRRRGADERRIKCKQGGRRRRSKWMGRSIDVFTIIRDSFGRSFDFDIIIIIALVEQIAQRVVMCGLILVHETISLYSGVGEKHFCKHRRRRSTNTLRSYEARYFPAVFVVHFGVSMRGRRLQSVALGCFIGFINSFLVNTIIKL